MKTDNEIIAEYEEKFCNKCEHKNHCHIPCVTITRYILDVQKEGGENGKNK